MYMLPVTVARSSSDDKALCYVLPVLWMTSYLHILQRIDQRIISVGARPSFSADIFATIVNLLTLVQHIDGKLLAVAICRCTSF